MVKKKKKKKKKEHVSWQLAIMIDSEPTKYMHQSFVIPTPMGQEDRGANEHTWALHVLGKFSSLHWSDIRTCPMFA